MEEHDLVHQELGNDVSQAMATTGSLAKEVSTGNLENVVSREFTNPAGTMGFGRSKCWRSLVIYGVCVREGVPAMCGCRLFLSRY